MADVTEKVKLDAPTPSVQAGNGAVPVGLADGAGAIFDQLDYGLLVAGADRVVREANPTAWTLLEVDPPAAGDEPPTCCALLGCRREEPLADRCITELALASDTPLPEMRVDLAEKGIWVTAARAASGSGVLLHLRPGGLGDRRRRTQPHWMTPPQLRVRALGNTHVESWETTLGGDWLMQRPGRLLKFLLVQPGRRAHVDEIIEALWPEAGTSGRSTVRYYVHILRHRLEPRRGSGEPSSFISSLNGTYSVNRSVSVDIDEFEALVAEGLRDPAGRSADERASSVRALQSALELYQGNLFAEDPYAEWAFAERERLRGMARAALEQVVASRRRAGDLAGALRALARHADGWPLDADLQRTLIELYLTQGRRSDATRRYAALQKRMHAELGEDPPFAISDLTPDS